MRSTNFLSRLLSGVKSAQAAEEQRLAKSEGLTTKATTTSITGAEQTEESAPVKKPGWKKVSITEEEETNQGRELLDNHINIQE